MNSEKEYFGNEGHLTDISIGISADRLNENRENRIPEEIRSHLEMCEFCRNAVMDIYIATMAPAEKKAPVPEMFSAPEPVKKPFLFSPALRTAATLLFLVFAAAVYLVIDHRGLVRQLSPELPDQGIEISAGPSAGDHPTGIDIVVTKKDAENRKPTASPAHDPFRDNPNLEYMVNSHHRGRMIHIISPETRELENGKIIFRWENHIDKNLILKILNNRNETVFRSKARGSRVEFTGNLAPGLYYWKLEDSENLYHVGKFTIK